MFLKSFQPMQQKLITLSLLSALSFASLSTIMASDSAIDAKCESRHPTIAALEKVHAFQRVDQSIAHARDQVQALKQKGYTEAEIKTEVKTKIMPQIKAQIKDIVSEVKQNEHDAVAGREVTQKYAVIILKTDPSLGTYVKEDSLKF
jgi:hypothetical protein